ncbi:QacE family quaternary ammonium compound efflux SMR transporter [Bacillus hwajinpoensis]|uniref:QacE family quaternary ammonium compound efflux SMR transporter n=1 Tax=Guptibacillus hwajinpoensis TaxID=208199 RepID=A0A845F172_9BACL|nr:SMR family transporter [Pseudalkalibacillus hwajinpoensis]MYL64466.1 QacE family quaternary ammonium compound efflux SMR transporter [Pseudalkalibacillus hwajinpoensis]
MIHLILALAFSIIGSIAVKRSAGFTKKIPGLAAFFLFGLCIYFLTLSVQFIEIGLAYAIWSGGSIAGTTIAGLLIFNEKATRRKFFSIALIMVGVVLL